MFRNFDSPTSPIPAILGQNSRLFGSLPNLKMQFGQDLSHGSSMSNLIPSSSEVFPSSFTPTTTIGEASSGPGTPIFNASATQSSHISPNVLLNADMQADEPPEKSHVLREWSKTRGYLWGSKTVTVEDHRVGQTYTSIHAPGSGRSSQAVKRSWCEHVLLKLCTRMGPRSDTIMLSSGLTCRRDQIDDPEVRRVIENLTREVAYWLDILNVDRVEMACLKGIILFNPGE